MIEIYKAPTPYDAYILLALLEAEGIEAIVENDILFNITGESPYGGESLPSVTIIDDSKVDLALKVVTTYKDNLSKTCTNKEWTCKECGASNPDSFEICWSCQKER